MKGVLNLVLLFIGSVAVAHAQSTVEPYAHNPMTLQECLDRGLEKNFSIKMVKNREEFAANNANPANAGLLPEVSLSASYTGNLHTQSSTERETGVKTKEKNTFDGTVDAGINLGWTLFDGFNVWTNYKQLKMMQEQGELETRLAVENYVSSLISSYYNFIQQRVRLNNYKHSMDLSRERLRVVEVTYHVGKFSQQDHLQALVDFNADSTQYMKQTEALNSSRIKLNEMMANENVMEYICVKDTAIDINPHLSYDELWTSAQTVNASLLLADKSTEIERAEYKKIMSRDYPYVRLNVGYGYTYNHFGRAAVSKRDNLGMNAGVTVGFKLFDGKRRMQKKNAELNVEYAKLEAEDLKLSLKSEFNDFWQAYKNNNLILQSERRNLETTVANYDFAKLRYLAGDISGFEMREAQKNMLDAKERILEAEYNTKMCEVSLMLLSGKIMEYLVRN